MIYSEVVTLINTYNYTTLSIISAQQKEHTNNVLSRIPVAKSDIPPPTVQMPFFCIKND
jgi:hypothetical protein